IRDDLVTGVQTCALPISGGQTEDGADAGRVTSFAAADAGRAGGDFLRGSARRGGAVRPAEGGDGRGVAQRADLPDGRAGQGGAEIGRAACRGGGELEGGT